MSYETILYEKRDGMAVIHLNRPRMFNAINSTLVREMTSAVKEAGRDSDVGALIITGSDKVFGAGADIKEIREIKTVTQAYDFVEKAQNLFNAVDVLPKPTIAAVAGPALGGGCELALACDLRIAAENARFGQPEIKIGVIPGGGGTQRLPRLVGVGRAKEILFFGEPIDAREAWRIGLVNRVTSLESLMNEAEKMAKDLVSRPAYALRMLKSAVNEGLGMDLRAGLTYEKRCFEALFTSKDKEEGMAAFIEKRKPEFKGC
jgi:enoyl-CoA hydratase